MEIQSVPLGYVPHFPGTFDWGPEIDSVPSPYDHAHWKQRAELERDRMLAKGDIKTWFPLRIPNCTVLPIIGGRPSSDWVDAVDVLIHHWSSSIDKVRFRMIDLTDELVSEGIEENSRDCQHLKARVEELAPQNSSFRAFDNMTMSSTISIVIDTLRVEADRAGVNEAAIWRQNLVDVASEIVEDHEVKLRGDNAIRQLAEAVRYAVEGNDRHAPSLTEKQKTSVADYRQRVVDRLQDTQARLEKLSALLRILAGFTRSESGSIMEFGRGAEYMLSLNRISPGLDDARRALAKRLLVQHSIHRIETSDNNPDTKTITVIMGADSIDETSLDRLVSSIERSGGVLIAFVNRFEVVADKLIGAKGHRIAGFFSLANSNDAERAATLLGKTHKFVLQGVGQSRSESVNWSNVKSQSQGWSNATTESWQTGQNFGTSLTDSGLGLSSGRSGGQGRAFTQGENYAIQDQVGKGGANEKGESVDYQRVYENVLEPSFFQSLGSGSMLIVDTESQKTRVVSCSRAVRKSIHVDESRYFRLDG